MKKKAQNMDTTLTQITNTRMRVTAIVIMITEITNNTRRVTAIVIMIMENIKITTTIYLNGRKKQRTLIQMHVHLVEVGIQNHLQMLPLSSRRGKISEKNTMRKPLKKPSLLFLSILFIYFSLYKKCICLFLEYV